MRKLISSMATILMMMCLSGTTHAWGDDGVINTAAELQTIKQSHQANQKKLWGDKIDPLVAEITAITSEWGFNYCGREKREYSEAAYKRHVQCLDSLQAQGMASEERIVQYQMEIVERNHIEATATAKRLAKFDAWLPND